MKEEFQEQIYELKEQYTQKLAGETKEEAKKEAEILEQRNKMKKKKQRITELKHQRDDMQRKISRLEIKNKQLREELQHQRHTIDEMKQTLSQKEREISTLRSVCTLSVTLKRHDPISSRPLTVQVDAGDRSACSSIVP